MQFHMQGGIGNQLFQLSYILDFKGNQPLDICLHRAQIHPSILDLGLDESYALACHGITISNSCPKKEKLIDLILVGLSNRIRFTSLRSITKKVLNTNLGDDQFTYLRKRTWGFFQNRTVNDTSIEKVRSLFNFSAPKNPLEVVVHFRGQDFLGNNFGVLGQEYYRRAAEVISSRVGQVPEARVVCLSKDLELAREVLSDIFGRVTFTNQSAADDFADLMNAKYLVLSNSTLAFWAASMSQHYSLVVVPNPSFIAHPSLHYPENWITCEPSFL